MYFFKPDRTFLEHSGVSGELGGNASMVATGELNLPSNRTDIQIGFFRTQG